VISSVPGLFAAELGARYFLTLHERALWAIDQLDRPG
jgi:hypothetical protein